MNLTPQETITLAQKAGVRFGEHAFVVVACWKDGFKDAWSFVRVEEFGKADRAKAHAEEVAGGHRARHKDKTFIVLEVGAPVEAPAIPPALSKAYGLIESMKGLIDEAMSTHIYDFANGDTVDPGCGYAAAVDAADAFLAENHLAKPEMVTLYVGRSENNLDIWSPTTIPGLEIVTLNWDIDDIRNYDAADVTMTRFSPDDSFEPCLVSKSVITGMGRTPEMRAPTAEDMKG